ncbi:ABC transporter ATP-binding protein [uncultured Eubacterium sp.]|uniref:ABC transporter ATP-binding protein n=1 Tax=uncultured Eubacterium sp. TaxID=165185 RepID=UPI0026315FF1|nr:ABC transporter ATP-binding protein [uncultured Eubacterium sp.]
MKNKIALELKGVTKRFGKVVANNNVSLVVHHGEILAILGENGSGKTTLMNMVSGIYFPDEGQIFVDGDEVVIKSPKDAFKYKIGMIHQHFKLVDVFTATENIVLGVEDGKKYNIKEAKKRVKAITDKYGFNIDLDKKIYNMSVSEKQTVEIIKVLYRGADILILDEPTAVLTPQETEKLFDVLRNMRKDGKSIIIITHKLHEVLEISDRVAILRKGEHVDTVLTKDANEQSLTEAMMGEKVDLNIIREEPKNVKERLDVEHLTVIKRDGTKALDDVSFKAYGGEILGIAGISGCGQKELLESIAGLQQTTKKSSILYKPDDLGPQQLVGKSPREIRKLGIALSFVPEDRLGMGLVGNMDIVDNMMLRSYKGGKTAFLSRKEPKHLADDIIEKLEVVTPSASTPVRRLSGGNVQKVLVGREIALGPKVLMVAYPVRGLDINSSYTIYGLLSEQKEKGTAVIFVGEDLDVLIELCDRIMVINSGVITGVVDGKTATKEEIGLLMTKNVDREVNTDGKE